MSEAGRITRWNLTAHVRVQAGECAGAVAVSRNGLIMDVIDYYRETIV